MPNIYYKDEYSYYNTLMYYIKLIIDIPYLKNWKYSKNNSNTKNIYFSNISGGYSYE